MKRYKDTTNFTYVFTGLKYYIEAYDSSLHHAVDPTCGEKDPHHFTVE